MEGTTYIGMLAERVAMDYLRFTGRGSEGRRFVTPDEYLAFRRQAASEAAMLSGAAGLEAPDAGKKAERGADPKAKMQPPAAAPARPVGGARQGGGAYSAPQAEARPHQARDSKGTSLEEGSPGEAGIMALMMAVDG